MEQHKTTGGLRSGVLNAWVITFFVVSAAGPLLAMAGGVPVSMLFGNGAGIPATFLTAMLILCLFSVGYTTMARHVSNAGAFYAFALEGLGPRAGGASGMIALLSYNALQISLYGMFGTAADSLLSPWLGVHIPWWIYGLAAMASIAILGYRQIDLSAKVLGVLVAGEYLVVMALDVCIMIHGGNDGLSLQPFTPAIAMSGAPSIGLMLCFSAFIGFEATTIYSEEARDPERTVPRATYFSVLLIGVFYTVSTWAVVMGAGVAHVLPDLRALDDPTKFLFALTDRYAGHSLSAAMRILFVTSIYASLLAFHNSIARYFFSLGRDRLLPARLGRTHPVHQSPHLGSLLQTALAAGSIAVFAILGADPILTVFTLPSSLATLGIILLMAITSAAILGFFRRHAGAGATTRVATVISLFALLIVLTLATLHFDVLIGSNATAPRLLPLLLVIAGVSGAVLKPHGATAGMPATVLTETPS